MKNFFLDSRFNMLRKKMGIEKGEYAKFDGLKINEYGFKLDPIKIEQLKSGRDVDISIEELDFTEEDPILRVGKVNVVLYVRDQYHPAKNEYKYHIAWCETLEQRKKDKKIDRYVITRKNDENFNVNIIDAHTHKLIQENGTAKMRICRGCLKRLNYKGYKKAGNNYSKKDSIYKDFSIESFLENDKRKKTYIPKNLDLYTDLTQPKNLYPSNWKDISRAYRRKVGWKCEKCKKDFSKNKQNLTVHHINSSKYDVSDKNLIALCEDCHQKEHNNY